jgi:TPR repeat protein
MLLRAALPLLLLASCASTPEEPEMKVITQFFATRPLPPMCADIVMSNSYISPWPEMADLQKAAAQGIPAAMFELGDAYELGLDVKVDLPKAMELYRAAAAQGHLKSLVRLGWCAEQGIGRPVDAGAALDFYVAAAAKDCPVACACLGRIFARGAAGVVRSPTMAAYWHRRELTLLEDADESRRFGTLYALMSALRDTQDLAEMEKLWQELEESDWADFGEPQTRLAGLMAEAYLAEPASAENHGKALRCLEKAPDGLAGMHRSLWPLQAQIHVAGLAVPKDLVKARDLYERAADFGLTGMRIKVLEMEELLGRQDSEEYWYAWTWAIEEAGSDPARRECLLAKLKFLPSKLPAELRERVRQKTASLTESPKKTELGKPAGLLEFKQRPFRTARDLNRDEVLRRSRFSGGEIIEDEAK